MTDENLPRDAVRRVEGRDPTARLAGENIGALIDQTDDPEGRVDVGRREWNNAVGLTLDVKADKMQMSCSISLSLDEARELAEALTRSAAEVEDMPKADKCPE